MSTVLQPASVTALVSVADEAPVLFRVVNRVGIVTLNRPAALNALSHAMVREIASLVERCRDDAGIVALVLRGAGERGFCAGGDVRALYQLATPREPASSASASATAKRDPAWQRFFVDEYRLDYALHTYPKPIVALLDGIVMGGGMGLGQAASLRVVTERTKLAMPETRIGMLPDVGATHFLGALPVELALYVGLTGAMLSGADALYCKLADLCVPSSWLASFEERLAGMPTSGDVRAALRAVFEPPCNIVPHAALASLTPPVMRHFDHRNGIERIIATLRHDLTREPLRELRQWQQATLDALLAHSPTMLHVTREALLRSRQMSLADCFRMELGIVSLVIAEGDFCEGVRAHLVDRDHRPHWAPATLAEVRPERVRHFLSSPWTLAGHPLADLGATA